MDGGASYTEVDRGMSVHVGLCSTSFTIERLSVVCLRRLHQMINFDHSDKHEKKYLNISFD